MGTGLEMSLQQRRCSVEGTTPFSSFTNHPDFVIASTLLFPKYPASQVLWVSLVSPAVVSLPGALSPPEDPESLQVCRHRKAVNHPDLQKAVVSLPEPVLSAALAQL